MWIEKGLCPVSTADWVCNKGNLEYVVVEGESINLWFVEKNGFAPYLFQSLIFDCPHSI